MMRPILTVTRQPLSAAASLLVWTLAASACSDDHQLRSTPTSPVSAAQTAAEIKGSTHEAIVIYPNEFGGRIKRIAGPQVVAGAMAAVQQMKKEVTSDDLAKIRLSLQRVAKLSKRHEEATELSLQVLDAFSAGSAAEFHERIARLPITIRSSFAVDSLGREGVLREYWVRGIKKISYFRINDTGDESSDSEAAPATLLESGETSELSSIVSPGNIAVPPEFCEYTDATVGYVSGDCATQQEKDDYLSSIAALETDVDGMTSEASSDSASYCLAHQEDYQFCAIQNETTNGSFGFSYGTLEGYANPLESGDLAPCIGPESTPWEPNTVGAPESCFVTRFYAFAGAAVAWIASKIWAADLAVVAGSSTALLAIGYAGLLLGFGAVAIALADLLEC